MKAAGQGPASSGPVAADSGPVAKAENGGDSTLSDRPAKPAVGESNVPALPIVAGASGTKRATGSANTEFDSTDAAAAGNKKSGKAAKAAAEAAATTQAKGAQVIPPPKDSKAADDTDGKDSAANSTTQVAPQPVAAAIVVANPVFSAAAAAGDAAPTRSINSGAPAAATVTPQADPAAAGSGTKDASVGDTKSGNAKSGDAKEAAPNGNGNSNATGDAAPAIPDAPSAAASGNPPAVVAKALGNSGKPAAADGSDDKPSQPVHPDNAKGPDSSGPGQADARHPASTELNGRSDTAVATGDPQSTTAPQSNTDPTANFGISTSNNTAATSATTSAAAGPSATPSPTPVPIAGLAVEIVARAQAGLNRFAIRLDPPELGRIDVRLDVDRDGQVTSHVTVDRADTLSLLQSDQPNLQRALEQAGLKTADNGLQFTLRDQSFSGQDNGGRSAPDVARLVIADPDLGPVETTSSRYRSFGIGGGVDISV
jgi:flagellar hook-length control protein FliK